jgi:16S rRNA (guanine966-N2)-methyltransferase
MRIIAGRLKGRIFPSPKGHRTHPMADRVRGGLFNILGDMTGLTVLDAFAGSGALSFEAISRGAKHAMAIEISKPAQQSIKSSIETLGLQDSVKLVRAGAGAWSDTNQQATFDIVIVAPPYDDLQEKLLFRLTRHVAPKGLYVLDWPGKLTQLEVPDFRVVSNKNYGDAQLVFYRRIS